MQTLSENYEPADQEGTGWLTVMREGATDTPAGLIESMKGVMEISTGWMLMPMGETSTP